MRGADQPSLASNARSNPTCAPAKAIASSPEDSDSLEINPIEQKVNTPGSSPRVAAVAVAAGLDHTLRVSPIWRSKARTRGAAFIPSPSEGQEASAEEKPALFSCTCVRERRGKQVSTVRTRWFQSNPIRSNPIQFNSVQSNPIHSNPIHSNPITSAINFQGIFRPACFFSDSHASFQTSLVE